MSSVAAMLLIGGIFFFGRPYPGYGWTLLLLVLLDALQQQVSRLLEVRNIRGQLNCEFELFECLGDFSRQIKSQSIPVLDSCILRRQLSVSGNQGQLICPKLFDPLHDFSALRWL